MHTQGGKYEIRHCVPSYEGFSPAASLDHLKAWHVMCQLNVFENELL